MQACRFVCVRKGVFTALHVSACTYVTEEGGGQENSEASKRMWSSSSIISGIYHCGNQLERKCWRRQERLIRGIRNQTTHSDGAKPY